MTIERQWQMTWEAGPDAGACSTWPASRLVVGRAALAALRCDDAALEPFHAQLDLDADVPSIRQLAGRIPVRVRALGEGRPWRVHVGNSVLAVEPIEAAVDRAPTSGHRRAEHERSVVRSPRHRTSWVPEPIHVEPDPPAPVKPAGGFVPAVVGLAATVVMAVVVKQMMYVMFAAVGTMVAASTFVVGRIGHRRQCREHTARVASERSRVSTALERQRVARDEHLRRTVPTLAQAVATIATGTGLWQRRSRDGDACLASLGMGAVEWSASTEGSPDVDHGNLTSAASVDDLPIAVDLCAGARVAVSGPHAAALANALIVQLAALTGPADWQLVTVTASPDRWRWTRHLPHARDALGRHLVVDEAALLELVRDGALVGRHTVVLTDQAAVLSVRTSALRRLESAHESLALVVIHQGAAPAMCTSSVVTMTDGRARLVDLAADAAPVVFHLAGTTAASAERWALPLRDRRDPEDERLNGADIPATVGLGALLAEVGIDIADPASIGAAWQRAGNDPAPMTPIGRASDGVVEIDFVRDGPHALLAGTTGAGKSELLRSLVIGLSCALGPQHLTFVLVDYKGGAAFDELGSLPHVVGTVTDLDHQLAERALRSLRAELTVRERLLRDRGVSDLTALRAQAGAPVVPRVLVVVDEFAALATEQADFLHALVGIAQRGRSLGVHLLLATQRPSGVISDDIRANTNLRMALRLHDSADAMDVVGDALPASLPRNVPGRAVMRLGPDELVTFQTAHATDVGSIVAAVRAAAHLADLEPPRPVWCDPLPERIERIEGIESADDPAVIGVVDLPDQQTQEPLRWVPADGSVLVVGSPGAGVTSTLATLAATTLTATTNRFEASPPRELFVIDAGNDPHWDSLANHPRCAGVVRLHERERLWRLLQRVVTRTDDDGVAGPTAVLVIDGLGALRHELDAVERASELELLDRIVTSTAAVLLIGADRTAVVPPSLSSRCAVRIVLHLHDAHDAAALGVPAAMVPPKIAGRAVMASNGAAAQLVVPRPAHASGARRRSAVAIGNLPTEVGEIDRPAPVHRDGRWRVPIGIGFVDLAPAVLEVVDGEHVLIAGGATTGRSTSLAHLGRAWLRSDRHAHVVVVAGRRSPVPAWLTPDGGSSAAVDVHDRVDAALDDVEAAVAADHRVLLMIDDAELFDDLTGRLTALISERTPGLLVVAAGRPDALRQSYGHWTVAVRRSRLGLLSSGAQDVDADLLGATLPRRPLLAARPGLFHLVDGGTTQLVQLVNGERGRSAAHLVRRVRGRPSSAVS